MSDPKMSTLNPNAAEYVPMFKRGADDQTGGFDASVNDPRSGNQEGKVYGSEQFAGHGAMLSKGYTYSGSHHGLPSQKVNDVSAGKEMLDEDSILDLEYLEMVFPGISEESLLEAYLANNGDLDNTIEMLDHLESEIMEPSENLPDTLDIGDVPDPDSQSKHASLKLKNVTGESSTLSSSPSSSGAAS